MFLRKSGLVLTLAMALSFSGRASAHDGGDRGDDHGNHGGQDNHGNNGNSGGSVAAPPVDDHGNNSGHDNEGDDDHGGAQNQNGQVEDNNNTPAAAINRLRIPLMTAAAGAAIDARGSVDIRVAGNRQRIRVEVEANVPDGTVFNVLANGLNIGVITTRFDEGEFELEIDDGKPAVGGLLPSAITMVSVNRMNGASILQAQFGALGTGGTAPGGAVKDGRKRVSLVATAAGAAVGAHGQAEIRVDGQRQRFKIEVEADVADGTVLRIAANGQAVGTLSIRFGEGEFELESEGSSLPAGLDSIDAIATVTVKTETGVTLLTAGF